MKGARIVSSAVRSAAVCTMQRRERGWAETFLVSDRCTAAGFQLLVRPGETAALLRPPPFRPFGAVTRFETVAFLRPKGLTSSAFRSGGKVDETAAFTRLSFASPHPFQPSGAAAKHLLTRTARARTHTSHAHKPKIS